MIIFGGIFFKRKLLKGFISRSQDQKFRKFTFFDPGNLRSGVLTFFSRREGTPDTITGLFVCRPLIEISVSENVGDAISQLPEVASWARITQGTNSVNLHAVLYSTADKNMVYFVKHVLLFRS